MGPSNGIYGGIGAAQVNCHYTVPKFLITVTLFFLLAHTHTHENFKVCTNKFTDTLLILSVLWGTDYLTGAMFSLPDACGAAAKNSLIPVAPTRLLIPVPTQAPTMRAQQAYSIHFSAVVSPSIVHSFFCFFIVVCVLSFVSSF
jgi:hypothetical protein